MPRRLEAVLLENGLALLGRELRDAGVQAVSVRRRPALPLAVQLAAVLDPLKLQATVRRRRLLPAALLLGPWLLLLLPDLTRALPRLLVRVLLRVLLDRRLLPAVLTLLPFLAAPVPFAPLAFERVSQRHPDGHGGNLSNRRSVRWRGGQPVRRRGVRRMPFAPTVRQRQRPAARAPLHRMPAVAILLLFVEVLVSGVEMVSSLAATCALVSTATTSAALRQQFVAR